MRSMSKQPTTVRLREEQARAIGEAADRHDLSQSEVIRHAIDIWMDSDDDMADAIPDSMHILNKRQQFIATDAKLQSLRAGARSRWTDQIQERFESGIRQDDLETFRESFKRDARILWPDDPDRVESEAEYIDQLIDAAKAAIEITEFDPIDPQKIFGSYETVALEVNVGEMIEDLPTMLGEIKTRLRSTSTDPLAVIDAVATQWDYDQDALRDVIESVIDKPIRRLYAEDLEGIDDLPTNQSELQA